ncbi:type IV conjugative transfer system coupling protein TraD [Endozoicomonas sp. SM1973]|uniref:Type IV conjugative transfer system coupling protein TraD n=1 Tax=Spartinivicinus marinus TaxID=2994442 RepID=A0A853I551_9GAMM|nr:type IV conjugative transfer system coupling protein TraD [Spartinivicinus marinus]MCX4030186.1 type IV conjugative transfer system coupling protein TraD [Spartinivicinus marinus]NYZ67829.1 type IV conjugative transfer system coupling protein TraD [Spartinivicinus marinus]
MSNKYTVETLLRPPVELYSALTTACSSAVLLASPALFMVPTQVAYGLGSATSLWALHRARQGYQIVRYQKGLQKVPYWEISGGDIPVSNYQLFLGKGFRWQEKHTQRMYEVRDTDNADYTKPSATYEWARRKEIKWEQKKHVKPLAELLRSRHPFNPFKPLPDIGGEPALHGVGALEETDVMMSLSERTGHTIVPGKTRVGKTRCAEVLITQDIHRGDVVIVLDPKGDADLLKRMYLEAKRAGRLDQFYVFHLGHPELSCRYNAVGSFSRITEVASRIANQLPGGGNSAAFKEFGWQFVNIIAVAVTDLGQRPNYTSIRRYIRDIDPLLIEYGEKYLSEHKAFGDQWEGLVSEIQQKLTNKDKDEFKGRNDRAIAIVNFVKQHNIFDPTLEGLIFAFKMEKTYFDKLSVALGPFLEKLTTGTIAPLIAPNYTDEHDKRDILDWEELVKRRGIAYVGLDALTDPEVANVVGESMFSDLTSLAGYFYKNGYNSGLKNKKKKGEVPSISIHGDEFSDLLGPKFITLVNKSGGAGYQLTLYTQTWNDIAASLGDQFKAGQIAGNIGTIIMFRVTDTQTAEVITEKLPTVKVKSLMTVSGVNDTATGEFSFTSNNQDRISAEKVPMLTPADINALPKGQAFALLNGSQLYKIRMPLASKKDSEAMPPNLMDLMDAMKKTYQSNVDWGAVRTA